MSDDSDMGEYNNKNYKDDYEDYDERNDENDYYNRKDEYEEYYHDDDNYEEENYEQEDNNYINRNEENNKIERVVNDNYDYYDEEEEEYDDNEENYHSDRDYEDKNINFHKEGQRNNYFKKKENFFQNRGNIKRIINDKKIRKSNIYRESKKTWEQKKEVKKKEKRNNAKAMFRSVFEKWFKNSINKKQKSTFTENDKINKEIFEFFEKEQNNINNEEKGKMNYELLPIEITTIDVISVPVKLKLTNENKAFFIDKEIVIIINGRLEKLVYSKDKYRFTFFIQNVKYTLSLNEISKKFENKKIKDKEESKNKIDKIEECHINEREDKNEQNSGKRIIFFEEPKPLKIPFLEVDLNEKEEINTYFIESCEKIFSAFTP